MDHVSPAAVLRRLNDVLRLADSDRFCTAVLGRFRRAASGWNVRLGVAGHPPPLLRRAAGTVQPVSAAGAVLGVLPEVRVTDTRLTLAPGDLLLLYTDGVPEARSEGEFYGDERLRRLLEDGGERAVDVVEALTADVLAFQAGLARDDIVVVALRAEEPVA
jgi:sigma-B regulation protein RsbU (phosphoserine phosphatase)